MAAIRIVLMIIATGLAGYWAHDYIETGAPSLVMATALLVVGAGLAVVSAIGGLKARRETGQ
jgi:hypothetical protein